MAPVARDAFRDAAGDGVAVGALLHLGAFAGVAHESALDQDGRVLGIPDDVIARELHAAVGGSHPLVHAGVDVLGEGLATRTIVERLEAAYVALPGVVVVDADEDRVAVAVADGGSLGLRPRAVFSGRRSRAALGELRLAGVATAVFGSGGGGAPFAIGLSFSIGSVGGGGGV